LLDSLRPGAPLKFTLEQQVECMAIACRDPREYGRPISHWSVHELADELIEQGIVEQISPRQVGRWLNEAELKPHQSRYWLFPPYDPEFEVKVEDISQHYLSALTRAELGERTISMDEMTGIQALERALPSLPMRPGKVERQEFEYIRHGTQTLIANFDVVTGQVLVPTIDQHRTEADFLAHCQRGNCL
jgi:hypothetical protein